MFKAEEIQKNYDKHLKIIDTYITERKDNVMSMLKDVEET